MRKEEQGPRPVSPVAGHPFPPRAAGRRSRVHGRREPSHPHDDVHEDTVATLAQERSRSLTRRGRTPVIFSIVTPIIVLTMSVVVAIAINACPYSEEILDPVVMFTSLYTGGLLSYVFVREMTKKKGGSDETT